MQKDGQIRVLIVAKVILCDVYFSALLSHYSEHARYMATLRDGLDCLDFVYISRRNFTASENDCSPLSICRVARVGAAARRESITPERTGQSLWATPPDLGALPEPLAPESGEGKDAGAPAEADAVGGSPSAAPKRHEVGRVARRARPEMSRY
jgi:hypothetical protein